jgi:uncharacterized membrane protein YadS
VQVAAHNRLRALSIFFGALPFAFALLRVVETRTDFRYLWVALASLCGAAAIMAVAKRWSSRRPVALSAGVFVAATTSAALTALLLGTMLGPGLLVVASAFGFCFAVGAGLHMLADS